MATALILALFLIVRPVLTSDLNLCLTEMETGLKHPTDLLALPGGGGHFLVSEQSGTVLQFMGTDRGTVLDLSTKVVTSDSPREERGLLSFTLDVERQPEFIYVCYSGFASKPEDDHLLVVARFVLNRTAKFMQADVSSEYRLVALGQPGRSNNGGYIFFGPQPGNLYVTVGSGGSHTQDQDRYNLSLPLGKVLRLNVSDHTGAYTIPKGNPFADSKGRAGAMPEIFAIGYWNPWRCAADTQQGSSKGEGRIFCGDVGGMNDNVDIVTLLVPGGVYRCKDKCRQYFKDGVQPWGSIEDPLYTHRHERGQALIGGPVYRGQAIPQLGGSFLFGDFVHGSMHSLRQLPGGNWSKTDIGLTSKESLGNLYILSITNDDDEEPLLLVAKDLASSSPTGSIIRLHPCDSGVSAVTGPKSFILYLLFFITATSNRKQYFHI